SSPCGCSGSGVGRYEFVVTWWVEDPTPVTRLAHDAASLVFSSAMDSKEYLLFSISLAILLGTSFFNSLPTKPSTAITSTLRCMIVVSTGNSCSSNTGSGLAYFVQ